MGVVTIHNSSLDLVIYDGIEIGTTLSLVVPRSSRINISNDVEFLVDVFDVNRLVWVTDSDFPGQQFYDQPAVDILIGQGGTTNINNTIIGSETISARNPNTGLIESVYNDKDILVGTP